MIKGMIGGALMVALLAGGVFIWAKLSGPHNPMGMGYGKTGYEMSVTATQNDADDHSDAAQHTDGMAHDDHNSDGSGAGATLAEAMGTATTDSETHAHTEGMDHDMATMDTSAGGIPTEPGQGAFAAVSEIVQMLMADPDTDWSRVNITALREHLVDMDMLITNADVETIEIDNGIQMTISLAGLGGGAASRMVPAHGPVLAAETGWDSVVEMTDTSAIWQVTSPENTDQIRALGFFGLMATGDHHRAHHIGMAKGAMVH